jgi:hypothetical protein
MVTVLQLRWVFLKQEVQEMSSSGCESEAEAPLKNLDRCETTGNLSYRPQGGGACVSVIQMLLVCSLSNSLKKVSGTQTTPE